MSSLKQSAYRVIYEDFARREKRVMVVLRNAVNGGRWENYADHPAVQVLTDQGIKVKRIVDVKRLRLTLFVE